MKASIDKKSILAISTGVLFIFVIWYIVFLTIKNNSVVPSIVSTLNALGKLLIVKRTYIIILKTLLRLLLCLGISFVISAILAFLAIRFKLFKEFIKPLLVLFKTIPIIVIIILLLLMFGRNKAFYFVVSFLAVPLLFEALFAGMTNVDKSILDDLKTVSNINLKVVLNVYFPLAWPYIITGLLQAFGLGLKVLVMAEYISQPKDSIGAEILFYYNNIMMEYVYAWSILLVVFVLTIEVLLNYINKKVRLI